MITQETAHSFTVGTFWTERRSEDQWTFQGTLIPARFDGEIEVALILRVSFDTRMNMLTLRPQKKCGHCKEHLPSRSVSLTDDSTVKILGWNQLEHHPDTMPTASILKERNEIRITPPSALGIINHAVAKKRVKKSFVHDGHWIVSENDGFMDFDNVVVHTDVPGTLGLLTHVTFSRTGPDQIKNPSHKDLKATMTLDEEFFEGEGTYNQREIPIAVDEALRILVDWGDYPSVDPADFVVSDNQMIDESLCTSCKSNLFPSETLNLSKLLVRNSMDEEPLKSTERERLQDLLRGAPYERTYEDEKLIALGLAYEHPQAQSDEERECWGIGRLTDATFLARILVKSLQGINTD